ncbi:hypothetical protein ES319_D06G197800v1 [Gossypium barbadense]|uniref:Uncharacterized protein n=2 Tax=Gossypium TaxID=3633 RepID=A0A5J5R5N9_GOSBA|nr:hypothetical protein ES319_D06G197800v1 [Gossypium barbadense]TYG65718.1 hypothetical protein ES288_D06G209100v1 [Gossypium darwinii]
MKKQKILAFFSPKVLLVASLACFASGHFRSSTLSCQLIEATSSSVPLDNLCLVYAFSLGVKQYN